jgi:hypothetical protein
LNTLADRSDSEEREFRTLSWFTDYADPARGWELALAEAATGHTINRQANRMLNDETSAWNDQDLLQQASALPMPCWFIHGSEDPRPQSTVNALSNAVPRSDLHIVHGAGHQLWSESPEGLRALLRRLVLNAGNSWGSQAAHARPLPIAHIRQMAAEVRASYARSSPGRSFTRTSAMGRARKAYLVNHPQVWPSWRATRDG